MFILSRILVSVNKIFYIFCVFSTSFLISFFYVGNIASRYFRNNDKSTLRSGAHPCAPCTHRNLGFRYARFVFWHSAERSQPARIHAIAGGQSTSARAFDASFTPTHAFCMSCPPPRGSYSSMRSLSMLNFSISFSTVIAARSSPVSSIATRPLFIKIVLLP